MRKGAPPGGDPRHRARADGLWLSPTVEWHAYLGVASIAKCDQVHIGAFGRWIAPADLVPARLRPRLEAVTADDAQLLLAIIAAVFIAHILRPGWLFLRHFAAGGVARGDEGAATRPSSSRRLRSTT